MRGQIQIQFNWLFVMIVGGLIIFFFTNLILSAQQDSQQKLIVKVSKDLETIATGAGVSKGTAQRLDKPDIDMVFDCAGCDCKYYMQQDKSDFNVYGSKNFRDLRIFAPRRVLGTEMIAWSLDWSVPFRVTNFLYISSPQTMYYIIDLTSMTSDLGEYINETLPSSIVKSYHTTNELAARTLVDNNYPSIKVFYITDSKTDCPDGGGAAAQLDDAQQFSDWGIEQENIGAACVYSVANDLSNGKVRFYKVGRDWDFDLDTSKLEFIGEEAIFASFFAFDYDNFACNMGEAFERLALIGQIYRNRTRLLKDSTSQCETLYLRSIQTFDQLIPNATYISHNVNVSYGDYRDVVANLSYYNRNLQIRSCPSIY